MGYMYVYFFSSNSSSLRTCINFYQRKYFLLFKWFFFNIKMSFLFLVDPVKDKHMLEIIWSFPSMMPHYRWVMEIACNEGFLKFLNMHLQILGLDIYIQCVKTNVCIILSTHSVYMYNRKNNTCSFFKGRNHCHIWTFFLAMRVKAVCWLT